MTYLDNLGPYSPKTKGEVVMFRSSPKYSGSASSFH